MSKLNAAKCPLQAGHYGHHVGRYSEDFKLATILAIILILVNIYM